MIRGYARVSSKGQARDGNGLEAQEAELRNAGAEIIYAETFTGTVSSRPQLETLLADVEKGDTVVITKLDRAARSAAQGFELIQGLIHRGVKVHVLNMGLMDDTPTGRLILHIMLAFAEFERDMIVERTREGKLIARQNPGFREGRPNKYSCSQLRHAVELCAKHPVSEVVEMTGISRSTIFRAKRTHVTDGKGGCL